MTTKYGHKEDSRALLIFLEADGLHSETWNENYLLAPSELHRTWQLCIASSISFSHRSAPLEIHTTSANNYFLELLLFLKNS